ncbi:bifunctional molybdopterin-guanine dinucleotide biosynthesis adaptor protein MobB/molybdopterin molybdotransferase MoeA [Ferrimonas balearica]|uniref:bifunctional molybdopterin-guanine dinucleotide biosynthesis adaptor protein MobB/molybdopterin molybdotransferase MoeA n=1 Tax=Ferrimonas balearica TaxID=44012 RepID=UPI001C55D0E7|nr:bifunctional molybdopterin-guanine dinucleotide biosynthesis adaptor protein MobB/molybdopterin molybdotransferase MoeA [Ferrimonas balearica]MBW3165965.1 bifunctional molybdopterin-guanine dinucleotide biosynthesis adaptor protein MobB/molybdopterin molybdotransferase MoeA [Ferrimonas balearica]
MSADTLLSDCRVPVLGICAYSGTGKTTLLLKLLPELNRRGLKVAVVKHAHHNFEVDKPGKDSFELRKAGADQMLIGSSNRRALMMERPVEGDPDLKELLAMIDQSRVDLILVEGFKKLALPKLELHRAEVGKPFVFTHDPLIQAIACDDATQLPADCTLPQLSINDVDAIADFVQGFIASWTPVAPAPLGPSCDSVERKQLSVNQGVARILDKVSPLRDTESLSLTGARGRVLASDAISPINVPQHTNSAMDGYAVAHGDADEYTVVGEVFAGHAFDGVVGAGEAVKIMTGAPLPAGVDSVVMRELAQEQDGKVRFDGAIEPGQNVRQAGEDIQVGATALTAGARIGAAEMGLLASLGLAQPTVYRRPKVAIFSTGDEVCAPEQPLKPNCIFDANRFSLYGMLAQLGCDVIDLGIIEDSEAAMIAALSDAAEQADVVISSGGVSVGDADFIKDALAKLGTIDFWKIAMRPGRPLAFGSIGNALFFGLPGNPVAVMVSFMQFVQPALRKLAGEANWQPQLIRAIATEPMRSRSGRTEFSRGVASLGAGGQLEVRTTGSQGSGILSSMVQANCLIVLEEAVDQVRPGEPVWVQPFADLM